MKNLYAKLILAVGSMAFALHAVAGLPGPLPSRVPEIDGGGALIALSLMAAGIAWFWEKRSKK